LIEIVLGPPGTGKTTTLLGYVDDELARGVPPDRIGYVTFTRRGADEAASRAVAKFNLSRDQLPWFRTLHSLCFRRLGCGKEDVLEGKRLGEFADYAGVKITGRWSEDGVISGLAFGDRALFMENLARVRCQPLREAYDAYCDDLPWDRVERFSRCLAEYKAQNNLLDFTDMLAAFVERGEGLGLEVLIVDEAQDLSRLQWEVVRVLSGGCRRVVVAGDDDQAIYAWAGADAAALVTMEGAARVLGQSWRVPRAVQDTALEIISPVTQRRQKEWSPRAAAGEVVRAVALDEADLSGAWEDTVQPVLILARNTYIIDTQVVPELRRAGIIYERYERSSVPRRVLDAVDAWESLRRGGSVLAAEARGVYEHITSGVGVKRGFKELKKFSDDAAVTLDDLERDGGLMRRDPWYDALDRLPKGDVDYLRAARGRGEDIRGRPRVRVSTIHGSKGGEAQHVVVLTEMARRTYHEARLDPDAERRVWYVAATRAKEKLSVVDNRRAPFRCQWL
jgi:DNA helicase II / ATP-dependent DNA helicase PcrA